MNALGSKGNMHSAILDAKNISKHYILCWVSLTQYHFTNLYWCTVKFPGHSRSLETCQTLQYTRNHKFNYFIAALKSNINSWEFQKKIQHTGDTESLDRWGYSQQYLYDQIPASHRSSPHITPPPLDYLQHLEHRQNLEQEDGQDLGGRRGRINLNQKTNQNHFETIDKHARSCSCSLKF